MKTPQTKPTGANGGNREGNLCSLRSLLFKSGRDGDADFVFLARDTASPYIDNRPLLVATKPELREYKAVYVQSDAEIGLFSDEVVVNCAP